MTAVRFSCAVAIGCLAGLCVAACSSVPRSEQSGMPIVFLDDFESGKADRWQPTDPNAWRIEEVEGSKVFSQFQASKYEPPVRSPFNIAWVRDLSVSDFVLQARMWQTGKEYGHRDMCVFFGKQDAAHFYYVHIATRADAHANSIFIVNGKDRVSIAEDRTTGTEWGRGWHTVRVVRDVGAGTIEVYFNGSRPQDRIVNETGVPLLKDIPILGGAFKSRSVALKPIMVAHDKTFKTGTIGFGTFDDTGRIDDVRLWGKQARE